MSRNILFLCHRVPYPPDKGDRIRSFHILRLLAEMGDVSLGFLADEPIPPATADWLSSHCKHVVSEPLTRWRRWFRGGLNLLSGRSATEGMFYSARFRRRIESLIKEIDFDVVVCFSSSMVQYALRTGLEPRTIVDLVDVDSQKWRDYADRAKFPLSWLFRWEANRVRRIETRVARAKAVVMCTEPEAEIYRRFCPQANSSVVCNGVDLDYFSPRKTVPTVDCLFVGYLDYRANVTGLQWFCEHVWPRVREVRPDAVFQIVGRNPTPPVQRLSEIAGVEVVGPVEDVRECLSRARVIVVPLLIARGVQNKILEAMAAGKPVVASPQALAGLGVCHEEDVLAAETPDEWVAALSSVLSDPSKADRVGRNARRYVEDNHQWDTCLRPFSELVESAAAGERRLEHVQS